MDDVWTITWRARQLHIGSGVEREFSYHNWFRHSDGHSIELAGAIWWWSFVYLMFLSSFSLFWYSSLILCSYGQGLHDRTLSGMARSRSMEYMYLWDRQAYYWRYFNFSSSVQLHFKMTWTLDQAHIIQSQVIGHHSDNMTWSIWIGFIMTMIEAHRVCSSVVNGKVGRLAVTSMNKQGHFNILYICNNNKIGQRCEWKTGR